MRKPSGLSASSAPAQASPSAPPSAQWTMIMRSTGLPFGSAGDGSWIGSSGETMAMLLLT